MRSAGSRVWGLGARGSDGDRGRTRKDAEEKDRRASSAFLRVPPRSADHDSESRPCAIRAFVALVVLLPAVAFGQIPQSEYAARRAALAARLPGDGIVLALGASEPVEDYLDFYQAPPFAYLTGYDEPDAALVLVRRGGGTTGTLFVQPKNPAREVWTGVRRGPAGARQETGLAAREAAALRPVLDSLAGLGLPLYVVGNFGGGEEEDGASADRPLSADEQFVRAFRARHPRVEVHDATGLVAMLRGRKSDAELDLLRKAAAITVQAQREAIAAAEPGMNEFELQALIEYTFRRNGADRPAFGTIVGSGPNATTLHYNRDDRFMNAGDVVVMDIGASYMGYAADVTRTVPVSGTFTPAQRDIYAVVRAAQAAAERQAAPGARGQAMEDSASAALAAGLARLGLIESPVADYDCSADGRRRCRQLQLYYMHSIGHGIGLEVHDPDQYYYTGALAPGSAFTIEPGIYVRPNLLEILPNTAANARLIAKLRPAVEKYRGIGVRIEDDYVVTAKGVEWISRAPREIEEVEAAMKEPSSVQRDTAKVNWYRARSP